MTLLLTSQGIQDGFKDIFLSLLTKPPADISVAYIITAAFGEKGDKSWVANGKRQLQALDISQIEDVDIRGKTEEELMAILSQKDIILVNGGNTFYLLKYARESGFDNVVKRLLKKDKLYIGISAGSYIACPTIQQAHWRHQDRNDFHVVDLTGLSLVPFLITAHFTEESRDAVTEGVKISGYPVVALHDTQAILVRDDEVKVIGLGQREFFNGFKES